MNINQLETYRKGLRVERLHTIPHVMSYSNGHHSANAALVAHEICLYNGISSASVVLYMLMHDVAESYVGDMPANVKMENQVIKNQLSVIEKAWEKANLPGMPDLHPKEQLIGKIADLVELGMYCVDELRIGNVNVQVVIDNVIDYLDNEVFKQIKGVDKLIRFLRRSMR